MLVLNRRPGESVIIEPDFRITVLSVADRRVRIALRAPDMPPLHVSAVATSEDQARLEVGPLRSVAFDRESIRIDRAPDGHVASNVQAAIAVTCGMGEHIDVGDRTWVAVASVTKGNPCVVFGGSAIGEELRITLIRPAGSYVRLGVEAPSRRVYREELWAAMRTEEASADARVVGRRGPVAPVPLGADAAGAPEAAGVQPARATVDPPSG